MLLHGDLDEVGRVICSAGVLWNDVVPVKNGHSVVCGLLLFYP
jgi:hypothetical protein